MIGEHARQFDEEVPDRPAGSQQESVALSYITGHLQQAGYLVRLESVPVANTIRSSDVIALAPSGERPETVVLVSVDTRPDLGPQGDALGTFLEIARALRVLNPTHPVEFVAAGANSTGDLLGSRRLISLLREISAHPAVIEISSDHREREFWASGPLAARLVQLAGANADESAGTKGDDPFATAGLGHTVVGGEPTVVGRVLLEFLSTTPG